MRRLRRWWVMPAVTLAVLVGSQSVAWADSHSADADVYRTSNYECTHAHGYINNESGQPHIDSYAAATQYYEIYKTPCYSDEWLGPYQIAVKQDLYIWNGSDWTVCNEGPWVENPNNATKVGTSWSPWRPCGMGYYSMIVYAYIYNNGWLGGSTATNYVWAA